MAKSIFVLFILYSAFFIASGSRILISSPYGTQSHQKIFIPLVRELVKSGHHVTIIFNNRLTEEIQQLENVRGIIIEELAVHLNTTRVFDNLVSSSGKLTLLRDMVSSVLEMPVMAAEKIYRNPEIQALIRDESINFDVVMICQWMMVSSLPLAWHFNNRAVGRAPIVVLSPSGMDPGLATVLGDSGHYSYVPFFLTSFSDDMCLFQRTINVVVSFVWNFILNQYQQTSVRSIAQKEILPDCPPLSEIEKNISLVFTNTHPAFNYPRAVFPQMIEIGGTQCRPPKPLPKVTILKMIQSNYNSKFAFRQDLEAFVASAESGFIVFSVGSAMRVDAMPEYIIKSFMDAFASLPQKVVWQWNGAPPADLSNNVLLMPWLPQQDLFGINDQSS